MSDENTPSNPALRFSPVPTSKPLLEDVPPAPDLGDKGMKESDGLNALLGDFMKGSGKSTSSTTTTPEGVTDTDDVTTTTTTTTVTTPQPSDDGTSTTTTTTTGVTTPAPAPTPDPNAIAAQVTDAVTKQLEGKFAPEPPPTSPILSESEQLKITNLQKMEELNPEKYKGYASAYEKNVTEYQAYADEWKAKNPGKTFDPSSHEHADFLEEHSMEDYESDDYALAAAKVEGERVRAEFEQKQQHEAQVKELEPQIFSTASVEAGKVVSGILGEESAKAFLGDGGGVRFDKDGNLPSEALESHPDIGALIQEAAGEAQTFSTTMDRMFSGMDQYDPNNENQAAIMGFIAQEEGKMMEMPAEARRNAQGQYFLPGPQYFQQPEAERSKYWTFTTEQLKEKGRDFLVKNYKTKVGAEQKRFEEYMAKRGFQKLGDQNSSEPPKPAPRGRKEPSAYDKQHGVDPNADDTPPKVPGKPESPDGGLKPGKVGEKKGVESDRDKRIGGWFKTF